MAEVKEPLNQMPKFRGELKLLREKIKVIGLAVISSDGFIARNSQEHTREWTEPEDFAELQRELSNEGLCVMGRTTHELYELPKSSQRRRLIFSRTTDINQIGNEDYINPETTNLQTMLEVLAHKSEKFQGLVYVLGGKSIYDYFLNNIGYDVFKLTIEQNRKFTQGIKLFSHYSYYQTCISGKLPIDEKLLNYKGTKQIIFRN